LSTKHIIAVKMAIPDAMQSKVGRSVVISTRSIRPDYDELKDDAA